MKHIIEYDESRIDGRSHAMLVRLNSYYKMQELKSWLKFRVSFLKSQKQLSCCYCGKSNLKIKTKDKNKLATIDHKIPTSKGGAKFDVGNLVVSCSKCNTMKVNRSYEQFLKEGKFLMVDPKLRKVAKKFRKIQRDEDRESYPLTFLVT